MSHYALSLYPDFLPKKDLAEVFEKQKPFPVEFIRALHNLPTERSDGEELALYSAFRIYTEWCMDEKNGAGKPESNSRAWAYRGEAFGKFLDDEKQFAARTDRCVEMPLVIDAFPRSALDFFVYNTDWRTFSPIKRGINIRRNLAPWIDNPQLIKLIQ